MNRSYDVTAVGAGPTGLATANMLAQSGRTRWLTHWTCVSLGFNLRPEE